MSWTARVTGMMQLTTENAELTVQVSEKHEQIQSLQEAVKIARSDTKTLQDQSIEIARHGSPSI